MSAFVNLEEYMYDSQDRIGVICISITGLISLLAILSLFIFRPLESTTYAPAALSCILFTFVLLRVRGNLILVNVPDDHTHSSSAKSLDDDHKVPDPDPANDNDSDTTKSIKSTSKWRFQHVPSSDSWQLVFSRDLIDTAMLRFAGRMVWFPISYTLLLLPSGIAGLSAARGHPVSPGAEVFVGVTYNLIDGFSSSLVSVSSFNDGSPPPYHAAFVPLVRGSEQHPGVRDEEDVRGGGGGRRGSGFFDEATEFFQHLHYLNHLEYRLVVFTDPADSETGGDVSGSVV
ncbi:hypothetical protein HHX47_DHR4001036 [Lentinula edodes]|nr:hypothetical protein HHX47_DHR4001036 [Lentinula edodes]